MAKISPWDRLRSWREKHGLTQAQAAERIEISRAQYVAIEAGELPPVRLDVAQAIEREAGVPLAAWGQT